MALKPTFWTLPVTVPETAVTFWSLTFDFAETGAIVTRIQIIDAAMPIVQWNSPCVRIRRSFRSILFEHVVQQLARCVKGTIPRHKRAVLTTSGSSITRISSARVFGSMPAVGGGGWINQRGSICSRCGATVYPSLDEAL